MCLTFSGKTGIKVKHSKYATYDQRLVKYFVLFVCQLSVI